MRKIAFIGEDHPVGLNLTNSFSVRKDAYSVWYYSLFAYISAYYCTYLCSFFSDSSISQRLFSNIILKTEHLDRICSSPFKGKMNVRIQHNTVANHWFIPRNRLTLPVQIKSLPIWAKWKEYHTEYPTSTGCGTKTSISSIKPCICPLSNKCPVTFSLFVRDVSEKAYS